MSRSVGSRRLCEESVSSGHLTKRNSKQTTGQFFDFDKYGRMSYRSQKVDFPSPSKWDAVSRRAKNEFKHARTDLSLQRVKVTCKSEPTGHETEEINSTTEKQESKSSAEVKYKATYIVYENQNLCKKELEEASLINYPGDTYISSELLYIKHNPEIKLPICLVLDAIWCGSLEILDNHSAGSQFYDGFVAHLPGKLFHKALEHAQLMPNVLPCTMLSCCNVSEEIFQNEIPTIEDIALFFFPGNFERSKEQYFRLVQVMETQDLVLRSLIKGVSLLIFSSKRLHLDPCETENLQLGDFLWGIFRDKGNHQADMEYTGSCTVDMEVDMGGGKDGGELGIVDVVVSK